MTQFGAGTQLAAQCPQVPIPDGWRSWVDSDGPVPDSLANRATAIASDQSVPLGTTESYPLPGVTTLLRVEPHVWGKDTTGAPVQGCFRTTVIYLPSGSAAVTPPIDSLAKPIEVLTAVSLAAGTVATIVALRGSKK